MKLAELLGGVTVTKLYHQLYGQMAATQDVEVSRVQYDSRKIAAGDCFVAICGSASDGHGFVEQAVGKGAKVVVVERDDVLPDPLCMHHAVVKVVVPDSRKALAVMAANQYGHPAKRMTLVGVTGTNGKTTTSHLVKSILDAAGRTTGLIGTIEYLAGSRVVPATHTTPESLELQELLAVMADAGCAAVSMEVSSHALDQSRVYGLDFQVGIFTNLTQDHLDYHRTMERYFEAKKILFDNLGDHAIAVVNADDPWSSRITESSRSAQLSYGIKAPADVRAADLNMSMTGTTFAVQEGSGSTKVTTPLIGRFNVSNVLAAFAAGRALGLETKHVLAGIAAVKNVKGRFERINAPAGWTAVVDYAHTPDALDNCLKTLFDLMPRRNRGRIITVFGAGGDRDRTKRPLMGKTVAKYSDVVIVTSDNPRTENPDRIIDEVLKGIKRHPNVTRNADRRSAIDYALGIAERGDVVLLAGKGHEDYQVIGKERIHFSDREVVEEFLK